MHVDRGCSVVWLCVFKAQETCLCCLVCTCVFVILHPWLQIKCPVWDNKLSWTRGSEAGRLILVPCSGGTEQNVSPEDTQDTKLIWLHFVKLRCLCPVRLQSKFLDAFMFGESSWFWQNRVTHVFSPAAPKISTISTVWILVSPTDQMWIWSQSPSVPEFWCWISAEHYDVTVKSIFDF